MIKIDMLIPKSCEQCRFSVWTDYYCHHYCTIEGDEQNKAEENCKRRANCLLIEDVTRLGVQND